MEWVEWRNKGLMRECRGNISQKGEISWARRGSEIGQSFIVLRLSFEMRPQHLLLYAKRMVIQLGDGI
jgi:hypothetical protein